jgi:hypothetical protein
MRKLNILVLLMMLSMISMMIPISINMAAAEPLPPNGSTTNSSSNTDISWANYTAYQQMAWNPQYLMLKIGSTPPVSKTTIIVQGTDTLGANIEAEVVIDPNLPEETYYIFNDSSDNRPVAFSTITGIFQQNGSDSASFEIWTYPTNGVIGLNSIYGGPALEDYLGDLHFNSTWPAMSYVPGGAEFAAGTLGGPSGAAGTAGQPYQYWTVVGENQPPAWQAYPEEPHHPDPIKILINWDNTALDLVPKTTPVNEMTDTADYNVWLFIEGLDEMGNKLTAYVHILPGENDVPVYPTGPHSWSEVSNVQLVNTTSGQNYDSYYILTEPMIATKLLYYTIHVDHVTISASSYDILANPNDPCGTTNITIALRDADGNLVCWGPEQSPSLGEPVVVNFATTGGTIRPSEDNRMWQGQIICVANLTADTNPRTIKVTADVCVPPESDHPSGMNMFAWLEITEDGVNSVFSDGAASWPIHTMQWGYYTAIAGVTVESYQGNEPSKPVLPPELGGPQPYGIKLDGPIYEVDIPLYVGCNLISSPVSPMMAGGYYTNYPEEVKEVTDGSGTTSPIATPGVTSNKGIPMDKLFSETDGVGCIEAVWWLDPPDASGDPQMWHVYVPGVTADDGAYFRDGVGYWIKAEKPCTLEFSGVWLENGPFTPPLYTLYANSWNLMGVTSLTGINITDYLSSVDGSSYIQGAGPVWVYHASTGQWVRNPPEGLWPGEGFWVYNKLLTNEYIAP